jgi:UDP-N-acetylmuramoyl-tripeptide--D-alanyl-D-alanine ligase
VENRQSVLTAPSGLIIIDDTFNANPAGATAALELLAALTVEGKRCVVTPGMIELGNEQHKANAQFAEDASHIADALVIVGVTNRSALREGVQRSSAAIDVIEVPTRPDAVAWVRTALGARDAVLYENDFPDHYP